ncbi:MAG: hypothetical protein K9N23_21735, partial [Akkermansiaceae bacterium]|nr:hypothetical protein [Akkermansiaceae bacterium]
MAKPLICRHGSGRHACRSRYHLVLQSAHGFGANTKHQQERIVQHPVLPLNELLPMKPKPQEAAKDLGKDLKTFEQLPDKPKELELLKDQAEKSTGQESAKLHK